MLKEVTLKAETLRGKVFQESNFSIGFNFREMNFILLVLVSFHRWSLLKHSKSLSKHSKVLHELRTQRW